MRSGETGRAFVSTRSRIMNGWFTLSSSLRAYDQLTARAMPMVTAAVVANRVRACQRRVFFTVVLDAAGNFGSAWSLPREEDVRPLACRINQHVRRGTLERMWREPVADTNAEDSGVAGGDHVDIGVADDSGLSCMDAGFPEQRLDAE